MASTTYTVTKSWVSAVAGAVSVNLAAPPSYALLYRVAGSLPGTTVVGHRINPGDTHPVKVGAGENLYLKLPNDAIPSSLKVVATDA